MTSTPAIQRTLEQNDSGKARPLSRPEIFLEELHGLIGALGQDGGISNGSIYDTAMVVRLAAPSDGGDAAIRWLFKSQNPDGSWDNPKIPRARETPTLAAMLALHVRGKRGKRGKKDKRTRQAVRRGLKFLLQQRDSWRTLPEDLLVGVEMTLTRLLEDARAVRMVSPSDLRALEKQYALVIEDGKRRRQKLRKLAAQVDIPHNTPPAIMWEGWGTEPKPALVNPDGGVGLSPAATAAWVHAAKDRPELQEKCEQARRFLREAEAGTLDRTPGVVPATWPIDGMEKQWGLFALLCAGLLDHPRMADVVKPHLKTLAEGYGAGGIGFTRYFMPDGDCTAVTLALLKAAHLPVEAEVKAMLKFRRNDHFFTYPQETNLSLTTTAHAVMGLKLADGDASHWKDAEAALWNARAENGRWLIDKWQTSWLYTTTHVMIALADASKPEQMNDLVQTLLSAQRKGKGEDEGGGWGEWDQPTPVETAYAVLALLWLRAHGCVEPKSIRPALARAYRYLRLAHKPLEPNQVPKSEPMWIGKALYCPYRMDQAFELSALVALSFEEKDLELALQQD